MLCDDERDGVAASGGRRWRGIGASAALALALGCANTAPALRPLSTTSEPLRSGESEAGPESRKPHGPRRDAGDWQLHSYDFSNSNFNPHERHIGTDDVGYLRRSWQTFNDDRLVPGGPPTGFALESDLGLVFPTSVVGVPASPIVVDGTVYWVDALGTLFARDARTGTVTDPRRHWTTTLVDNDFTDTSEPVLPELFYTAPVLTNDHVWLVGSVYGRLHAVARVGGKELDFDASTPRLDPYPVVTDLPFASALGDPVIVRDGRRKLLIAGITVILNDAIVQGQQGGVQVAVDITNPIQPAEAWRTFSIDKDASGKRFGTGVSIGSGLAVDFERHLIIGGTGQNTTPPYPAYPDTTQAPPGYVDRGDSLYAIDYRTGRFVWNNQFHAGDVFDLNDPVGTGPLRTDGPRDADVLSPPILFSVRERGKKRDLTACGSKGGLFRAVDRDTGATVWERQISKATGLGGIQAGAAIVGDTIYVAGFEGIDDGFSDAQFGISFETGKFPNAFFATFSPVFWADVEHVRPDNDPATGMRVKVYALSARDGSSKWQLQNGSDFVELLAGAALRHVSVANGVLYVTTTSGQLFALDAKTGEKLFSDQTLDLNASLGSRERQRSARGKKGIAAKDWQWRGAAGKRSHHASMNAGTVISRGMVYVAYGAQNDPSGGLIAYELNRAPEPRDDSADVRRGKTETLRPLQNDRDPNGDRLRFVQVAGRAIDVEDEQPDAVPVAFGRLTVFNPGDDPSAPDAAYINVEVNPGARGHERVQYQVEDIAPPSVVNGEKTASPEPTHRPRRSEASLRLHIR